MTPSRNDDLLRALTQIGRRERRDRLRQALEVVKAARKAGLPVKAANIEGVDLQFAESENPAKALTPLDAWKAKRNARQA